jgi:hypothetical protein
MKSEKNLKIDNEGDISKKENMEYERSNNKII